MSEKATTSSHKKAKQQRKPRGAHSNKDVNHHQTKDLKEILGDEKKDVEIKTEPSDTKYCKKEIENNWNKYEIRMETYEEYEKKENMGADYEELSKIPFSGGDHFQFKHEKITHDNTPTEYDTYFRRPMDTLSAALLSIPFFERNSIDQSIFRAGEIENMIHRSNKCADKYKQMVKKNIKVTNEIIKSDNNVKLHRFANDTSTGTLPEIRTAVLVEDSVKSETNKPTLLNIDTSPSCDSISNVDQQAELVNDAGGNVVDSNNVVITVADTVPATEVDIIASPNKNINDDNETPAPKSTDDLEKWLDDFLDDS